MNQIFFLEMLGKFHKSRLGNQCPTLPIMFQIKIFKNRKEQDKPNKQKILKLQHFQTKKFHKQNKVLSFL